MTRLLFGAVALALMFLSGQAHAQNEGEYDVSGASSQQTLKQPTAATYEVTVTAEKGCVQIWITKGGETKKYDVENGKSVTKKVALGAEVKVIRKGTDDDGKCSGTYEWNKLD